MSARAPGSRGWDLQEFARHYDRAADRRGGWRFDPDEHDVESLRRQFEQGGWASLEAFAESRFEYDQRT